MGKLSKDDLAVLEKKVNKQKERYATEMKDYKPPPGYEDDGDEKGVKKKKKKDPNAPKRATSAFMLYSSAMRPIINKDKERYNKEMVAYKAKKKAEVDDNDSDGMDDN